MSSSGIICDRAKVAPIAGKLAVLADMAEEKGSFGVSLGANSGHPRAALNDAAEAVRSLAQAESYVIAQLVKNIIADVADYEHIDHAQACKLLSLGSKWAD